MRSRLDSEIFSRLNGEALGPPVGVLEDVLGRLEEVEATLHSATSTPTGSAAA